MTHLQLTPEEPPPGSPEEPDAPEDPDAPKDRDTPDDPDRAPEVEAPGPEGSPDELRLAEAARLQRYELERAADEGMTEPPEEIAEADLAIGVGTADVDPMTNPGFEEAR